YLAVEGRRVLAALADRLPLAAELHTGGTEKTCSAAESLEVAGSRVKVADPPPWFGVIKPLQIARVTAAAGERATDADLHFEIIAGAHDDDDQTDDEDDDGPAEESKILKLFDNP